MIRAALWEEIQRLFTVERHSKSAIARDLGLDVKTVRRCLRQPAWRPYQRAPESDTLLTPHHAFLETRAPAVDYSAQILYQELPQQYGYTGSYDTVKREEKVTASLPIGRDLLCLGTSLDVESGR